MFETVARKFRVTPAAKVEAFVRQIVDASVAQVVNRVAARVATMSASEARGYVRARSAAIIRQQAQLAMARQPRAAFDLSAMVIHAATERLIPHVLRQTSGVAARRTSTPRAA